MVQKLKIVYEFDFKYLHNLANVLDEMSFSKVLRSTT